MKKYLLSLFVVPLLFVGFSSAQFTQEQVNTINRTNISRGNMYRLDYDKSYNCIVRDGTVNMGFGSTPNEWDGVDINTSCGSSCVFPSNSYKWVYCAQGPCTYILTYTNTVDFLPVSSLSGVVNNFADTMSEFIPYVVYIGLAILSSVLGFFAIKWLINWVRGKSLGVFSSRKKR